MRYSDHDLSEPLPFESRQKNDDNRYQTKITYETIGSKQQERPRNPQASQNRYIEEDILDSLGSAFNRGVAGVKATFDRMVDHAKAFLTGVGAQIATFFIPSKIDLTTGFTFLTTYLGFIMLFPSRPNRFALGVGIAAGIVMILSGQIGRASCRERV